MAKRSPIPLNVGELEQIKVLRASGFTPHAIGKRLGRDHKTIAKACRVPAMAMQIEETKSDLADDFEDLTRRFVASIKDDDIARINARDRVVSAGICTDKMRLLRGESTANIGIHTIVERIERKRRERQPREDQKETAQERAQQITAEAERMKGSE